MKWALLFILLTACAAIPPPQPKEVVIKIESEIPVSVSIYKSCEGNWNFCKWN
jgi:hypothetical protein